MTVQTASRGNRVSKDSKGSRVSKDSKGSRVRANRAKVSAGSKDKAKGKVRAKRNAGNAGNLVNAAKVSNRGRANNPVKVKAAPTVLDSGKKACADDSINCNAAWASLGSTRRRNSVKQVKRCGRLSGHCAMATLMARQMLKRARSISCGKVPADSRSKCNSSGSVRLVSSPDKDLAVDRCSRSTRSAVRRTRPTVSIQERA